MWKGLICVKNKRTKKILKIHLFPLGDLIKSFVYTELKKHARRQKASLTELSVGPFKCPSLVQFEVILLQQILGTAVIEAAVMFFLFRALRKDSYKVLQAEQNSREINPCSIAWELLGTSSWLLVSICQLRCNNILMPLVCFDVK